MAKTSPWYSIQGDVFHNNTNCLIGSNIAKKDIKFGTGRKPLCKECAKLYVANLK